MIVSHSIIGHDTRKIGFSGIMEEVKKVPRLSFVVFENVTLWNSQMCKLSRKCQTWERA